jgi:uncharacterized protein YegL
MLYLIILLILILWMGIGAVILFIQSPKSRKEYTRKTSNRIYTIDEKIPVSLEMTPPVDMQLVSDNDHDVILAIDHSGSMGAGPGSPLAEALRSAQSFVKQLTDKIYIGIIAFDHEAQLLCGITNDHKTVKQSIKNISPGGATAIHYALNCAHEALTTGRKGIKKTVILFTDGGSNYSEAEKAAQVLRDDPCKPQIISVGFGPYVDENLLINIAGSKEYYIHVEQTEDFKKLFSFLAAWVSEKMAVAGFVQEQINTPKAFELAGTFEPYPVGVKYADQLEISWAIPLMKPKLLEVYYELKPLCPGWHNIVGENCKAIWQMPDGSKPDGSQIDFDAPMGPKVLIMPRWFKWAWPVLNPLFWMLFGKYWCKQVEATVEESVEIEAPPLPTFPEALPAPEAMLYQPELKPALIIGLGETGEWTLCRLKERLADRKIEADKLEILQIQIVHHINRKNVKVGISTVEADERIELHQDLRPYIEELRGGKNCETRTWIPWLDWLSDNMPLTVSTNVNDRRKARLAILQHPEEVEAKLKNAINKVLEQEGSVIIAGSPYDPECSGLLGEIAHICATNKAGSTVIFSPPVSGERSDMDIHALCHELERMIIMGGEDIFSDRTKPPVPARQLFDRIIVLDQEQQNIENASILASEMIWNILSYEKLLEKLPPLQTINKQADCWAVHIHGHALPMFSLWEWVREETLARFINGQWLRLNVNEGYFTVPNEIDGLGNIEEIAKADADSFRDSQHTDKALGFFLAGTLRMHSPQLFSQNLLLLIEFIPIDKDYSEQVTFCNRERINFARYLEHWCSSILERNQKVYYWGFPALMRSLIHIEDGFNSILDQLQKLAGDANLTESIDFMSNLYVDFRAVISGVRQDTGKWIAKFIGEQPDMKVEPLPDSTVASAYQIEKERKLSLERLKHYFSNPELKSFVDKAFKEWMEEYGSAFLDQIKFHSRYDSQLKQFNLLMYLFGKEYNVSTDITLELRTALDQYEGVVLNWPLYDHIQKQTLSNPDSYCRVGKYSERIYPSVSQNVDDSDPFLAEALQIVQKPLSEALGVTMRHRGITPYVWPEEFNAQRIADKIRNVLEREPKEFSPYAVHLMRNTEKLYGFFYDLAKGNVKSSGAQFILLREGNEYSIAADSKHQGIELFQNVVRQVVSLEISTDGKSIPFSSVSWNTSPEQTIAEIEKNPLVQQSVDSHQWNMWKDIIHGLMLEYGD